MMKPDKIVHHMHFHINGPPNKFYGDYSEGDDYGIESEYDQNYVMDPEVDYLEGDSSIADEFYDDSDYVDGYDYEA